MIRIPPAVTTHDVSGAMPGSRTSFRLKKFKNRSARQKVGRKQTRSSQLGAALRGRGARGRQLRGRQRVAQVAAAHQLVRRQRLGRALRQHAALRQPEEGGKIIGGSLRKRCCRGPERPERPERLPHYYNISLTRASCPTLTIPARACRRGRRWPTWGPRCDPSPARPRRPPPSAAAAAPIAPRRVFLACLRGIWESRGGFLCQQTI